MHYFLKFILGIKLYMFRTVPLSIIGSFFTVHSAAFTCDKSVTTQNLAFLRYWLRKKCLRMQF